jgi:hypothetical protein
MNAAASGQASVRVTGDSLSRRVAPFAARALVLTSCLVAASAMSDDGVSINIRRSSAGGSFQPLAASNARKQHEKRGVGKGLGRGKGEGGRRTSETPRAPRPTAETFGDDFSGRGKGRPAMPRRHGDGGVTLPAGPGSKPWERAPKAQAVRKVEPASAPGAQDKNMARVRYGKAGAANRHDLSTFSVESFSDAALKLLPALVENLEHKFGASNMTHVQKGSVPAILQVHYEYTPPPPPPPTPTTTKPTSIMIMKMIVIMIILQGADVLLRARTGTGKTLAYLVPIVQYLADRPERVTREQGTHALIVVPTRELAVQVLLFIL